jgi:hypothetical protein
MTKKYLNTSSAIKTRMIRQLPLVAVMLIVGSIGTIMLVVSRADNPTPYASITADQGTLAGNACKVNDPSTKDGTAVEFGGSCITATCSNTNAISATLCWNGDFETGNTSQFSVQDCQPGTSSDNGQPAAVSVVTSPVRSGSYAGAIRTTNQTIYSNCTSLGSKEHPHVAFISTAPTITDGSDYYIGFSVYVPSSFPKNICYPVVTGIGCWMQILEPYGIPFGGSPPIQVGIAGDASGNHLTLSGYPGGYPISASGYRDVYTGNGTIWTSPDITDNVWQDFVLHVHFSSCGGSGDMAIYAICGANQSPGSVQFWWGDTSGKHVLARQTFTDGTQTSTFANLLGAPFGTDGCGVNFENAASDGCSNGIVSTIKYTAPTSNIVQFDQYHGAQNMDICPSSGGACTNWTPSGVAALCPSTDSKCVSCTIGGVTCTSCTNNDNCITNCTTSSITNTNCYQNPCPQGDSCYSVPDLGPITLYYDQDKIGTTCATVDPSDSNCGQSGSSP